VTPWSGHGARTAPEERHVTSNVIRIRVHVRPLARLVVWAAPFIGDAVARRIPGSGLAAGALAWAVDHIPARLFFSARA
jgi:hypothetical protein